MMGFLDHVETTDLYRVSRDYTRRYAKSFFFASLVLPREKRQAAYSLYSFCRYADNIIDDAPLQETSLDALKRINELRDQLRFMYAQTGLVNPRLLGLRDTVFAFQIPQELLLELLRGVEMDLTRSRYATFAELEDYCYCVASVVGLMMTRVFGYTDDRALEHALHLGTAMQLTNILRDIDEDYQRGRIYLPLREMQRFRVTEEHIRDGRNDERWKDFMAYQVDRAYHYYAMAEPGVPMLPNDGSRFCVRLMSCVYGGILKDITNHDYNVFGYRAHVPDWKKAAIALGAVVGKTPRWSAFLLKDLAEPEEQKEENKELPIRISTPTL